MPLPGIMAIGGMEADGQPFTPNSQNNQHAAGLSRLNLEVRSSTLPSLPLQRKGQMGQSDDRRSNSLAGLGS